MMDALPLRDALRFNVGLPSPSAVGSVCAMPTSMYVPRLTSGYAPIFACCGSVVFSCYLRVLGCFPLYWGLYSRRPNNPAAPGRTDRGCLGAGCFSSLLSASSPPYVKKENTAHIFQERRKSKRKLFPVWIGKKSKAEARKEKTTILSIAPSERAACSRVLSPISPISPIGSLDRHGKGC